MVKNLPAMEETQVQSLSQEDLLEKGMAIHSSILAWRIPWTEEPGRLRRDHKEYSTWDIFIQNSLFIIHLKLKFNYFLF